MTRMLLWHGSRMSNLAGILSRGILTRNVLNTHSGSNLLNIMETLSFADYTNIFLSNMYQSIFLTWPPYPTLTWPPYPTLTWPPYHRFTHRAQGSTCHRIHGMWEYSFIHTICTLIPIPRCSIGMRRNRRVWLYRRVD